MKYITFDEGRPLDLILLGRITIDFNPAYTDQVKEEFKPLKNVHMFEKFVGGSPANIAVGVTRYGLKPGFLGKVSNDQFGDFVVDYFNSQGIDTSHITRCKGGEKLGLTFTEMLSPSQSGILMYRNCMCHTAIAFAKQNCRKQIIACASSVGPGAANMVTACATATVNNIPLLVFPADTFASRQPDPVLQQLEQSGSLAVSTNDAFKPVCKYWDRVTRPEQVMTALINAMRVLTDPAETGACCISLPQDVEGESYDFPEYFFEKRVHRITRPVAVEEELEDIAAVIASAKKPLVIVGGGVRYSEAGEVVENFCQEFNIPFGETQAGKGVKEGRDEARKY